MQVRAGCQVRHIAHIMAVYDCKCVQAQEGCKSRYIAHPVAVAKCKSVLCRLGQAATSSVTSHYITTHIPALQCLVSAIGYTAQPPLLLLRLSSLIATLDAPPPAAVVLPHVCT